MRSSSRFRESDILVAMARNEWMPANRIVLILLLAALAWITAACGKAPESTPTGPIVSKALTPDQNLAASSKGARATASSSVGAQFAVANLNDGTQEAWGAAEGQDDVYAAVVLPSPQAIREFRLWLFTPNQPPRAHLRDIRVINADAEDPKGPKWRVVGSRLSSNQSFAPKLTIPPLGDGTVVRVEIDSSDPNWGPHKIWGFGCFTASQGDQRNYLTTGTGVYVRELQMK
jgi:hypothetical protein